MFARGEHVVYFEHRGSEVRQHYGTVVSARQCGTYDVIFDDLPQQAVWFAYLARAL